MNAEAPGTVDPEENFSLPVADFLPGESDDEVSLFSLGANGGANYLELECK